MTNVEQARAYIATAPLAVSGRDGDKITFKVACAMVHGFMLDADEAMDLMREYSERLAERWSRTELRHKIKCAITAPPIQPFGYMLLPTGPYKPTPPAPQPNKVVWKFTPRQTTDACPNSPAVTNAASLPEHL